MKKLIKYFNEKPRILFLIDSIGAFTTAFFLFVITQHLHVYFGIPKPQMTYLLIIALCYSIYSGACFLFIKGSVTPFMKLIGVANILYCALTIGILIKYWNFATGFGTTYFLIEIVIICTLSYVELKVAKRIKRK